MKKQSIKQATTKHEFNSAMIGIILFDGTMQNDHILYIRHGGKQLEYVDEKVRFLSKYITPTSLRSSVDKLGYAYRYAYYNTETLKWLYKSTHKDGKKVLTSKLLNRFTPLTLAFMYMDDGCLGLRKDKKTGGYKSREIHINTQSFTMQEVVMLRNMIYKKYGVDFHITTDRGKPRMWCNTKNTIKFLEIVAPIVKHFPSMHYKLDLKYKNKPISFI